VLMARLEGAAAAAILLMETRDGSDVRRSRHGSSSANQQASCCWCYTTGRPARYMSPRSCRIDAVIALYGALSRF